MLLPELWVPKFLNSGKPESGPPAVFESRPLGFTLYAG